jgi:hypothetical protein
MKRIRLVDIYIVFMRERIYGVRDPYMNFERSMFIPSLPDRLLLHP